jgi:hypothetical protein
MDAYQKAITEYDPAHERKLLQAINEAIVTASMVAPANAYVFRPAETIAALVETLAYVVAASAETIRSQDNIDQAVDGISATLSKKIASVAAEPGMAGFTSRGLPQFGVARCPRLARRNTATRSRCCGPCRMERARHVFLILNIDPYSNVFNTATKGHVRQRAAHCRLCPITTFKSAFARSLESYAQRDTFFCGWIPFDFVAAIICKFQMSFHPSI